MPLALVTGASSGIGKAYAERLAADGFDLLLVARRQDVLDGLAATLRAAHGIAAEPLAADLSCSAGIERVRARLRELGAAEVLVHAAGFGTRGHVTDLAPDVLESQVYLHDVAGVLLSRAVLPEMKARNRGALILVSSLAAFFTTAEYTVYSATKAFLNTFCQGLRDELAGTDVKVQAVCPGLVKTGFMHTELYGDFDYSAVPEAFWLTPEAVVAESLERLRGRARPVVMAGRKNRLFVGFLRLPVVGSAAMALMSMASRRRVAKGLPALY